MPSSNLISRRTALALGDVLNTAFTRLVQIGQPTQLDVQVDGELLYEFLFAREYDEEFCNYMRALRGQRAIKDVVVRIQTGSFGAMAVAPLAAVEARHGLLLRLAQDILRNPEQQKLYYKPSYVMPLLAALRGDGYGFDGGRVCPLPQVAGMALALPILNDIPGQHLAQHVQRLLDSLEADPEQALGSAKELVESVCKTILSQRGKPPTGSPDMPELIKLMKDELELVPATAEDATKGREYVKRIVASVGSLIGGLAELRSLYGTGHGREGAFEGLKAHHARLTAGMAVALAGFLWETHVEQQRSPPGCCSLTAAQGELPA